MSDRIVLADMIFQARHGVYDWEKADAQRFEVDVELEVDVRSAGVDDDLAKTVDYGAVYDTVREAVESTTFDLIEALAESIAQRVLHAQPRGDAVVVRVRKPQVRLGGPLAYAGVEIRRVRKPGSG
jgi:dihydroneopterin aldolase